MPEMKLDENTKYNIGAITNREKGVLFIVRKDGRIKSVSFFLGKLWVLILNKLTNGSIYNKVKDAIDNTLVELKNCIDTHPELNIEEIRAYQATIYPLISKISCLTQSIYTSEKKRDLEDVFQQRVFSYIGKIPKKEFSNELVIVGIFQLLEASFQNTTIDKNEWGKKLKKESGLDKKFLKHIKESHSNLEVIKKINNLIKKPLIFEAKACLKKHRPKLVQEGTSGTWLLYGNQQDPIGVFKPSSQEPGSEKNPKNRSQNKIKERTGIPADQGYMREILAYKLDEDFAKIPCTHKMTIESKKNENNPYDEGDVGSFQKFIKDAKSLSSLKPQERRLLLREDIQRMALQDLRMLNADRHLGNVLVDENNRLIPIDHGLCFPGNARRLVFGWMTLSQSRWPLSPEDLKYIKDINLDEDRALMKKKYLSNDAIERALLATMLLKKGAEAGLSPYQIGQIMLTGDQVMEQNVWHTRWKKESYFETEICKKVLNENQLLEDVIDRIITSYKNNHNITEEFEQLFSKKGWERKQIGSGLNLFKFTGKMFGSNQKISVLRLEDPSHAGSQYQLRVIKSNDAIRHSEDDPKIDMTKAIQEIPGAIALVNGGYFHYRKNFYPWPKEDKFEADDPVGALMVNGKCISVNPKDKPLWGMLKIFQDHHCKISEEDMEEKDIKDVLGCAPVLIKKGKRTDLHSRTLEATAKVFNASPPGRFVDHIHDKHPRTLIGVKEDGTTFLVSVEGREREAEGMNNDELAELMSFLGVRDALNLDGGGSTQMLLKNTEDSSIQWIVKSADKRVDERSVATALAIVDKFTYSESWKNNGKTNWDSLESHLQNSDQ